MATRTSFRPRPVDINKQLTIVRDLSELDSTDGLLPKEPEPGQGQAAPAEAPPSGAAPAAAPAPGAPHGKKPKPKEIPVPEVKIVPTYTRDYLPTFKIPDTYIRGKGGVNYASDDYVEYDLDNEDEDWLEAFNRSGDHRLTDIKFERMLWKLELAWADASEVTTTGTERAPTGTTAAITCLPKVQAITILRKTVGGRDVILEQVYEYWANKRKRWGKPILRRLQPPTNPNDTNPYNVFRPRDKVNRPLTRRRRENSAECHEKLRQIRESILRALELAELVILRERKKSDMHQVDMTMQRCQLNLQHQPPSVHTVVEQQAAARLQELMARSQLADARIASYMDAAGGLALGSLDATVQRSLIRKRRKCDLEVYASMAIMSPETLAGMPPPVAQPELEPLWAFPPNLLDLPAPPPAHPSAPKDPPPIQMTPDQAAALSSGRAQPYVGRGGRVVLARCDPLTLEPFGADDVVGNGGPHHQSNGEVQDSKLYAFHPGSTSATPWALALDMSLLPECIDKVPIQAAQQQWLDLQGQLGRLVEDVRTPGVTVRPGSRGNGLPVWLTCARAPHGPAPGSGRGGAGHRQFNLSRGGAAGGPGGGPGAGQVASVPRHISRQKNAKNDVGLPVGEGGVGRT